MQGIKNAVELPKEEILMDDAGDKNAVELPKKELLMDGAGGKKCNGITKKGNFDKWCRGLKIH